MTTPCPCPFLCAEHPREDEQGPCEDFCGTSEVGRFHSGACWGSEVYCHGERGANGNRIPGTPCWCSPGCRDAGRRLGDAPTEVVHLYDGTPAFRCGLAVAQGVAGTTYTKEVTCPACLAKLGDAAPPVTSGMDAVAAPVDTVRAAMARAVQRFGDKGDRLFNAAGFGIELMKLAGLKGVVDGKLVSAILTGRADVEPMRPGDGHYRLLNHGEHEEERNDSRVRVALEQLSAGPRAPGANTGYATDAPQPPAKPGESDCDCRVLEDPHGNAEVVCGACRRWFRGNICVTCTGTGQAAVDPVTSWAASGGSPIPAAMVLLRPNCATCGGSGISRAIGTVPTPAATKENPVEATEDPTWSPGPSCRGCGRPLYLRNVRVADGCPCNGPRGLNHGIVPVLTCTCDVCDPAGTGSVRQPFDVPAPVSAPAGEAACPNCDEGDICFAHQVDDDTLSLPEAPGSGKVDELRRRYERKPAPAVPAPGAGEGAELTFAEACEALVAGRGQVQHLFGGEWKDWGTTEAERNFINARMVVQLSNFKWRLKPSPAPRPRVAEMVEEWNLEFDGRPTLSKVVTLAGRVVVAIAAYLETKQCNCTADVVEEFLGDRAEAALLGTKS